MFRRFVTRCTSVYVLSIHTLCSHSLNEYTTVLEVWDFPFLLPHNPPPPSSSLLHPPSRAMKVSRVGSYSTPLSPLHKGRGMWDRTAPPAKRHLRFTEARGHHAPTTTHLIEIDHNWRFSSPLDRQVFHNPTHAVVSRPGQAGLEAWLYSSIESSQRTRTLTHPSHASFSCLLPSSTPSISRPLLHHLLSFTLQHSCSCSTPRHRSPPPLICSSSSTPVAVEAPTNPQAPK